MPLNRDDDGGGYEPPGHPSHPSQTHTAPTYDYLYTDPDGTQVFQGNDGNLYRWQNSGPNGFEYVPYSGPGQNREGATPPKPGSPPPPNPAPNPNPGGMGGLLDPFDQQFHPPGNSNALDNLPPVPIFDFQPPPRFEAPSWDEVLKDPGFQFRVKQGNESITNNAAAQGMARHGNTLKDFINYNQDAASGEYGNVYNRRAGEHDRLYGETFGEATAKFAPEMEGWRFLSSATQRQSELDWDRAWQQFNKDFDIFKWNKQWPYSVLSDQQHMGLSAN